MTEYRSAATTPRNILGLQDYVLTFLKMLLNAWRKYEVLRFQARVTLLVILKMMKSHEHIQGEASVLKNTK